MTKNNSGMLPQNRTAFLEAMAENCVLGLADKNMETAVRLVIEQMAWSLEEKDEFETEEFDAFVAMVLDDYKDQIEGSPDELKDSLKRYCRLTGLISPFISFNTGRLCYVFNSSEMKDYLAASGICRWFEMQKEVIYLKYVRGFYPDARKSNVLSFILTLANPKIRAEIHKDIANGEAAKWREAPFNLTMHRRTICGIDYGYAYQKNFFLSPEQELEGKQAELTEEENKDEEF